MIYPDKKSRKTARLVMAAICELGRTKGLTKNVIEKHIENEYAVPLEEFQPYVGKVIRKGIAFGAIRKCRGKFFPGRITEVKGQILKKKGKKKFKKRSKKRRKKAYGYRKCGSRSLSRILSRTFSKVLKKNNRCKKSLRKKRSQRHRCKKAVQSCHH